jgi:hypothetical protein
MENLSKKQEIYSLLTVVISGLVAAALLTVAMTIYYTTEGTYRAINVVVDPTILSSLRYVDQQGPRGDKSSYTFDKITYSFTDTATKQYRTLDLTQKQYEAIYALLSGDTSVRDAGEDVAQLFSGEHDSTLAVVMKNAAHQSFYTLMRIEISSDGNYYRAQLRGNGPADSWAYFSHPKILEQITQIVKP